MMISTTSQFIALLPLPLYDTLDIYEIHKKKYAQLCANALLPVFS